MADTELEARIQELIDIYMQKYCVKHECSMEEAKHHIAYKIISEYYHENPPRSGSNNLPRTELDIGCKGGC